MVHGTERTRGSYEAGEDVGRAQAIVLLVLVAGARELRVEPSNAIVSNPRLNRLGLGWVECPEGVAPTVLVVGVPPNRKRKT